MQENLGMLKPTAEPQNPPRTDAEWMTLALRLAKKAESKGEVPVGALIVQDGKLLSAAYNERETLNSALGHAECLAIHRASRKLGSWRLPNTTLYVTLEPCLMCAGAILQSRIDRVVFGAFDAKAGAVSSLYKVLQDSRLNHRTDVIGGMLKTECGMILTEFFRRRRKQKKLSHVVDQID